MRKDLGICLVLVLWIILLCMTGPVYGQSGIFDRCGVIPGHGSHGSLPEENIDLFTGNVTLRYRDVFLPGPNGLDVEVWRVYNSKILKDWQSGQPGVQAYHKSWVGIGWTMHMGMVHQETSSTPVIEFPDGRLETAFLDKNDALNRYITRDFLRYDKIFHELYFQDGVIWKFGATATIYRADGSADPVRLVTEIKNSYDHKIVIAYNPSTSQIPPTINTITDSFGRVVTFSSSGTPRKLQSIRYKYTATQYRTINYSVGTFGNGYTKLNEVWPPCLPPTRLEYYDGTYELKKITTSYGGESEYIYDDHGFYFGSTLFNSRVMVQKKIRFNPGEDPFVWNYGYPDYNGEISGDVNVQGPIYNESATYNAYDPANPWKLGTISSFHYEDGSSTDIYDWTFQEISLSHWWLPGTDMGTAKGPLTSSVTRQRLGNSTLKEEFLYDEMPDFKRYGLPWQIRRYVNGSESPTNTSITDYYFWTHPSYEARYLLSLPSIEADFFSDGTLIRKKLTDYYEEDGKWGAKRNVRLLKQGSVSEYNEWTYGYVCIDGTGARIDISVSGPAGSEKFTTYIRGVPSTQSIGGQEYANCTISEFDSSVKSVRLQDLTSSIVFTYDELGRVILEDWPDDRNDKVTNWPYGENKSITTRGDETIGYNIVTKFWDGMGRDTGYTEEGDNTTLYFLKTLDAESRIEAQSTGSSAEEHLTNYEYNSAGDIVEITNPEGRVTHIELVGTTKTIRDPNNHITLFEYNHLPGLPTAVTDAQGHRAVYSYDDLGRLMGVDYNNGARTHSFQYDRADNLLSETHPETGTISYTYNEEGWLLDKTWGNVVTHYGYTAESGRLSKIYFGEESNPDEITYLSFDQYNQVTWAKNYVEGQIVWERDPDLDRYGNVTSETIVIPGLSPKTVTYTYDRNNNPEKITYPDQNWAKVTNNGLNAPEKLAFNNDTNLLVNSASYGYNKAPTSLLFARNGTQFTASYDNSGALDTVYLRRAGTDLYNADYEYDGAGNVLSIASTAPAEPMSASFVYDELNRLVSATYTTGRVSAFSYEYDPYGNMKTVQENGQPVFSKNYDGQNRIYGDGYDARGNVTSDGTYNYHWDKLNRLSHVTNQFSEVLGQYSYDERGLRFLAMPPLPEIAVFIYAGEVPDEIEDGEEVIFDGPVGGPPVQKSFTIKNEGLANLLLDGSPIITITGPNADQFGVTQQPVSPILPLGNSTFIIEFHPTSPGTKTAYISIANNDLSENPFDITLTGNLGPEMDILNIPDGGSWDFGEVEIGQSTESDFVIENTGRGDLLLTGVPKVRINGDDFGQFSVRRQPDSIILGGQFTYFVIRYSPVNEGPATAEVSIENNDLDENPYTFTISGTGLIGRAGLPDENDIDITEPDGDELIVAGETQTIAWKGGKATQSVRIEYSTDNGSTYSIIAERAPNTGTFDWTVPSDYSPVCLIRISDADGTPPEPNFFSLEFDLRIRPEAAAAVDTTAITIRVAVPDAESQATYAADLAILYKGREAAEALRLNLAESAPLELGSFSEKWRHFQVAVNKENLSCSVAVDGQPILDEVPLNQLPFIIDRPEVDISCQEGSLIKTWLENLELKYQDRVQALAKDGGALLRPLAKDAFDRYVAGVFPQFGGWLFNLLAADGSLLSAGQAAGQIPDPGAVQQGGLAAGIDEGECLSPTRSFRFEKLDTGSFTVVKRFMLPARLPYALSQANFSIISQETKLLEIKERLDAAKKGGAGSSGTDAQEGVTPPTGASGGSSMSALTSTRVGTYYIYTFDGRLLAEYDIYGICLKEYIYMGSRLIAEFNPSTSQYLYYTQDQIGSTRIVTDDTGAVVYATAHDPYGGIQKVWVDAFDPKRKFSDKERDGETGLDYFGARYFNGSSYRFITVDPIFNKAGRLAIPQLLNLYAYCRNNPLTYLDPYGLECYVFYDPYNFSGQALAEQRRLKEKYPDQEVILVSITAEAEFQKKWASMVDPVEVTLIFHSGSGDNSMTVVSIRAREDEYLTSHPSKRTPAGRSATYIGDLDNRKFKELNLYICHAGNPQVLNNVAEVFFRTQDVDRVKASPGFVNFNNPYISARLSVLGSYLPAYAPKDSTRWIYKDRVP